MEIWQLLVIIFGHTVADFVFQSDRVAKGKSSNLFVLLEHIVTYMFWMLPFMVAALCFSTPIVHTVILGYIVLNGALHFFTDFVTSKLTTYFWKKEKRHAFFVTIGFDQFIHIACLLLTTALFV